MKNIQIKLVPFGSPLYERMKVVRDAVLRMPLGLRLSEKDVMGEEMQTHIAAVDEAGVLGTVVLKAL